MTRRIVCANCGGRGHIFKECADPVTSCGVICRRSDAEGRDMFLLVQRKDSFAFVEFMRGKYRVCDTPYISRLFDGMTIDERRAVAMSSFEALWMDLWNGFGKPNPQEYEDARDKFDDLRRRGCISWLIETTDGRESPEWGFPKGRRALSDESDVDCAIREMREETGIDSHQVRVMPGRRFEERFMGSNGVEYNHVYFLADLIDDSAVVRTCDREVRDARWVHGDELIRLVAYAPTRVSIFRQVCDSFRCRASPPRQVPALGAREKGRGRVGGGSRHGNDRHAVDSRPLRAGQPRGFSRNNQGALSPAERLVVGAPAPHHVAW